MAVSPATDVAFPRTWAIELICACSFLSILAGYILEYSSVYAMNDQFNSGIAYPMNAALPLKFLMP